MNIQLMRLSLRNFKGIRMLDVNFGHETTISGDNATGKTSIFDAFTWLLFGKDTTGRNDFEIKTLNASGNPIHRLEHEVSATLQVDGMEVELRRIYKEKWIKKRGSVEPEFSGHTEDFFYNDVPLSKGDYGAKIASILDENIFRLITNPLYFNSLKWQERRQTLLNIAGEISNTDILQSLDGNNIDLLTEMLNQGKTVDEFKREITAKKKKIKDELEMIPARIDELNRSLPDSMNWETLEGRIAGKQSEFDYVEAQLLDQSKALQANQSQRNELQKQINSLAAKENQIKFDIENAVKAEQQEKNSENALNKQKLSGISRQKKMLTDSFASDSKALEMLKAKRERLIADWQKENAKTFEVNENEFICPTCKRELETSDIDAKRSEMIKHFNEHKQKTLADITGEGKQIKAKIETLEKNIDETKAAIETLDSEALKYDGLIKDFEARNANQLSISAIIEMRITANAELKTLAANEQALKEQLATMKDFKPDAELHAMKKELQASIYALRDELSSKERIEKIEARIEELKDNEKNLAGELARQEGIEFTIQQFMKAKMDTLERRINDKFSMVKFRLFDIQINGGEVECCDTLINGVPFSDANHAGQLNAGLDIINALCEHYDVTAPCFIDNAESTNKFIPLKSQMIKLVVTKDKKLKIDGIMDVSFEKGDRSSSLG